MSVTVSPDNIFEFSQLFITMNKFSELEKANRQTIFQLVMSFNSCFILLEHEIVLCSSAGARNNALVTLATKQYLSRILQLVVQSTLSSSFGIDSRLD